MGLKWLIFNASARALLEMAYFLSCFSCAHVHGFSQNLLSSHCRTASEYHPSSASASIVLPSQQKITVDLVILFVLFFS